MACSRLLVHCVVLFMTAGASDPSGDVDALHRELIKTGDRSRRQVLNSCKYTTAFRREVNPKCKVLYGHTESSDEIQTSETQGDMARGAPPRRRLASSGMHALGKLLASDAAALSRAGSSPPKTERVQSSDHSHVRGLKPPMPAHLATPKHGDKIPLRKQRGRGRFTVAGEGASNAHMVRDVSIKWCSINPIFSCGRI